MEPVSTPNWFSPTAPVPATPTTPVSATPTATPVPAAAVYKPSVSTGLCACKSATQSAADGFSLAASSRLPAAPANRISTSVWLLAGTADWFCRVIVSAAEPSAAAACSPTTEPFATAQPVLQFSKCPSHTISVHQYPWSCITADRFCAKSCGAIGTPSDRLP